MSERKASDYVREDLRSVPTYVWVLALSVLFMAALACLLWAFFSLRQYRPAAGPSPTPVIWTATPPLVEPTAPLATETPAPTPTASPDIAVGRYVRVINTDGVGVSLRQDPDVNSARVGIGIEGEVFIILDGPRQMGGYVWWKLSDPEDEALQGWSVANYLEPVDHP